MTSDTPRTDAAMEAWNDYETRWGYRGRMTEFARQLERDLAAANARLEKLTQELTIAADRFKRAAGELNAASGDITRAIAARKP